MIHEIWKAYTNKPFSTKLFIFLRFCSAPFKSLVKLIPKKGTILDLGCGHGLLELVLKSSGNKALITGIDPDKRKIEVAKELLKTFPDLKFKAGHFTSSKTKYDCIVLNDVEYLLPHNEKVALLSEIKKSLSTEGIFVLKTNQKEFSLGYLLCYLQEMVTVTLSGTTFTQSHGFYFYTVKQYKKLFQDLGFKVISEKKMHTWFYHPHYAFVLKKAS